MQTESTVKPPSALKFLIEETGGGRCNIHFYENIREGVNPEGDALYTYDWYVLEDVPYHPNLKANIKAEKSRWLAIAKEQEDAEPEYTEFQLLQQEITERMLENIEQGQQITELELLIRTGGEQDV